jgi:hypothetical protein
LLKPDKENNMNNLLKILSLIFLSSFLLLSLNQVQAQDEEGAVQEEAVQEEAVQEEEVETSSPMPSVPPRGQTGFIEVKTIPAKATVYLDGDELGLTPIEKTAFRSGRFDFTIILNGEELVKERVNIWPNKTTTIDRELKIPYGTIILTTKPGYTTVFIDGEEVAKTSGGPLTINNVSAGTHLMKVSAKRRGSREVEVTVEGEDTVRVEVILGK